MRTLRAGIVRMRKRPSAFVVDSRFRTLKDSEPNTGDRSSGPPRCATAGTGMSAILDGTMRSVGINVIATASESALGLRCISLAIPV